MSRIVFVHGMRQEGRDAAELRQAWIQALDRSWTASGVAQPEFTVEMPYYGDTLHRLTEELRGSARPVTAKGTGDAGEFQPMEEALLREIAAGYGVTDAEVRAELGSEVVAKGPANWEWVQGIARVLEHRIPAFRTVGLRFVRQVDAYLTRPHIRAAVDALVEPALQGSPDVVIAHSLGSIVTYRLLRRMAGNTHVRLLLTVGSPLGINAVRDRLRPPSLEIPPGISRWINGADERDYVALQSRLDESSFCPGIENLPDFRNPRDDAHSILGYLADKRISQLVSEALTADPG
ncbi:MAG TPA: hypothetical protein VGD66_06315 [Allosphingosinicella sp.]|jgi:hypothetical protein